MQSLLHYLRTLCIFAPRLAWNLSGNPLSAAWLTLKLWVFLVCNKLFGTEMTFSFCFLEKRFCVRLCGGIDVAVLAEVFVLREYDWKLDFEPNIIVDLGAHWGDSSIFYALRYPDAKVYAVEPAPDMFARLQAVVSQFPNVVPVNAAVSEQTGEVEFFVSGNSLGNSLQKRNESDKALAVRGYSLQDFKTEYKIEHIDLLKFDIEGAEEQLFAADGVQGVRALIGELHFDLISLTQEEVSTFFKRSHDVTFEKIDAKRSIMKATKHES
jgi:FkbM family methyltransferase